MTITFGRVGLSTSGDTLLDPERWDRSGDQVTISGVAKASTAARASFLAAQLNGLNNNPDEPYIACTWTEDTAFDGYYQVLDVQVPSVTASLSANWFPYTITLLRVPTVNGYAGVESALVGAVISNGHSVTSSQIWHATPNGIDYFPGDTGELGGYDTRASETGTLNVAFRSVAGSGPWNLNARYAVNAADFYNGAAKIETDLGSSTYRTVVGRKFKSVSTIRLNNGVMRFTLGTNSIDLWNGSSWETVTGSGVSLCSDGSSISDTMAISNLIQVLRNSPEEVCVRATYAPPTSLDVVTVDYVLRRGAFHVTGFIQSTAAYAFSFNHNTSSGSTSTGTYLRSADDANGNRWFSTWAAAATANTGTGAHYLDSSATSGAFALGAVLNYATAVSPSSFAAILSGFWGQLVERMTVVRR